jgi:hypothetical protein
VLTKWLNLTRPVNADVVVLDAALVGVVEASAAVVAVVAAFAAGVMAIVDVAVAELAAGAVRRRRAPGRP